MRTPSRRTCAEVENAEGVFQGACAGFCIGQSGCESTQSKSRARLRPGAPTGCSRYMSDLWIGDIAAWLPVESHCQSQSLFGALCLKTLSRIAEVFSLCNQGPDYFGIWVLLSAAILGATTKVRRDLWNPTSRRKERVEIWVTPGFVEKESSDTEHYGYQ